MMTIIEALIRFYDFFGLLIDIYKTAFIVQGTGSIS